MNQRPCARLAYLTHFDAVVERGHVQRAAALVVGRRGGVRAARQHPADEVLPAGVHGLVEGNVAAVVLEPQAVRVRQVEDPERGQLALGRPAMCRTAAGREFSSRNKPTPEVKQA